MGIWEKSVPGTETAHAKIEVEQTGRAGESNERWSQKKEEQMVRQGGHDTTRSLLGLVN